MPWTCCSIRRGCRRRCGRSDRRPPNCQPRVATLQYPHEPEPPYPCRRAGDGNHRTGGSLLSGQTLRSRRARSARGRTDPLRCARPHHACRVRRHDGQRQDRPVRRPHRRGGVGRRAGHRHRPQGGHDQPVVDLSRPASLPVPAVGQRRRRPPQGTDGGRVLGDHCPDLGQRAERMGAGPGAHPQAQRVGRVRHLYPGQRRGHPCERDAEPACAGPLVGRRGGSAARTDLRHRVGPPGAGGRLGRPGTQPRAHPAVAHRRACLAPRGGPGPGAPHRGDPAPAFSHPGRAGHRQLLPRARPHGPGDAPERRGRLAKLWLLAQGSAAGHRLAHAHPRRPPTGVGVLHRPPERRRAHVLCHPAPGAGGDVDAPPVGHHLAALPALL